MRPTRVIKEPEEPIIKAEEPTSEVLEGIEGNLEHLVEAGDRIANALEHIAWEMFFINKEHTITSPFNHIDCSICDK